jgi:hypothetical protein
MSATRYENLTPSPESLIESLRSIGYSIESAIADIIDNSITAGSTKIEIDFSWNGGDPWIAFIDEGCGMDETELINAMRFGSTSPSAKRAPEDMGRFGLGLKTASLSQCKHLTVFSKKNDETSCCEWDLDYILSDAKGSWSLGILDEVAVFENGQLERLNSGHLENVQSGTIVLWEKYDQIDPHIPENRQENHFNSLLNSVRDHLELVFHRFLSPDIGHSGIKIMMNGNELKAFNPFNSRQITTTDLPDQKIVIENEQILVQPYVLPHHAKISRQEYNRLGGRDGYLNNQGFYIYRNRRLIIKGTWFRLIRKQELNKLIRVRVDFPSSLDHLWKIDVKKSFAHPSERIRNELKQVISRIEAIGRRVYIHKGSRVDQRAEVPVWFRRSPGSKIRYEINRDYPLILGMVESLSEDQIQKLNLIISTIESGFPTDLYFSDYANKPEDIEHPNLSTNILTEMFNAIIEMWISSGVPQEDITQKILQTEPFAQYKDEVLVLCRNKGLDGE